MKVGDLILTATGSRIGLVLEMKHYAHGGWRINVLWEDGEIYPKLSNYCRVLYESR